MTRHCCIVTLLLLKVAVSFTKGKGTYKVFSDTDDKAIFEDYDYEVHHNEPSISFDTEDSECVHFHKIWKGDKKRAKKCCKALNTWRDFTFDGASDDSVVNKNQDDAKSSDYDNYGKIIDELMLPQEDAMAPGIADLQECFALGADTDAATHQGPGKIASRNTLGRGCLILRKNPKLLRSICCATETCDAWRYAAAIRACHACRTGGYCSCSHVPLSG